MARDVSAADTSGDGPLTDTASVRPDAASSEDVLPAIDSALRVLFVGNSYTYVNGLPQMVSKIASTGGVGPAIAVDLVVEGGASLQGHWDRGIAQTRITNEQWSHVVLQGQSKEAVGWSAMRFAKAGERFGKLVVQARARPVFFVTWARAPGAHEYNYSWYTPDKMQDAITDNYARVSRKVPTSVLSCVGEAYRTSMRLHPEIVLHQSDKSHPTVAGTYLAASTFYVALTGSPVPPKSEVPSGISLDHAAMLRDVALVGTNCRDVHAKGELVFMDCLSGSCPPFDFGVAGTPIPHVFVVRNLGLDTIDIQDGILQPPFAWTSGSYPGGLAGTTSTGVAYCSNSLDPGADCALSVSYQGTKSDTGKLTLLTGSAYAPSYSRDIAGESTTRALLTLSTSPGLCNGSSLACMRPCNLGIGERAQNLIVTNRGALPTTLLAAGTGLTPPFNWGASGTKGTFPGGAGVGQQGGVSYDYCSAQGLAPGQQCIITLNLSSSDLKNPKGVLELAYSDAHGPLADAACDLTGFNTPP